MGITLELPVRLYLGDEAAGDGDIEVFRYPPEALSPPQSTRYHGEVPPSAATVALADLYATAHERAQRERKLYDQGLVDFTAEDLARVRVRPIGRMILAAKLMHNKGTWLIAREHAHTGDKARAFGYVEKAWPLQGDMVQIKHLEVADMGVSLKRRRRAVTAVVDSVVSQLHDTATVRIGTRPEGSETRSRGYLDSIGMTQPASSPVWGHHGSFVSGRVGDIRAAIAENYTLISEDPVLPLPEN